MNHLIFPTFRLNLESELVSIDGEQKRLRPKTWAVLVHLAMNPGRVVTKDELLDHVWQGVVVSDDMPRLCVGEIRGVLKDNARSPTLIETVHGRGYRLLVRPRQSERTNRPRLAVFRFEEIAESSDGVNDGAKGELGDLLTQGLTSLLATHDEIDVSGGKSASTAQRRYSDLSSQGRALSVATVLRGTVRRLPESPRQLEVTAELFETETSKSIWQRGFGRNEADLAELQVHIADEVTDVLRANDQPSSSMVRLQRSRDTSVHHLYLKGLRLQDRYESATWNKAESYYLKVTEIDPEYALAWSGLAAIALLRAHSGSYQAALQFEEARQFSERALEIDPDLPDAHSNLASVEVLHHWNFDEAERRFKTALALRPSYSRAYFSYQSLLSCLGRHDDARRAGQRGFELDPLSMSMVAHRGFAELVAREPAAALSIFNDALEGDNRSALARLGKAAALRDLGRIAAAIEQFEHCRQHITGPMVPALIAQAHALANDKAAAQQGLENMISASARAQRDVPLTHRAMVHGALGETDRAFELLSEAVDSRQSNVVNLIDVVFDPIRSDARFKVLAERVGLPEAVLRAT